MNENHHKYYGMYEVYDARTDKIIDTGTLAQIENYLENPGRYIVYSLETGEMVGR